MTIIGVIHPIGVPIMFGDLLVSGHNNVDARFSAGSNSLVVPSLGVTPAQYRQIDPTHYVSLCQKISLITPNLAVGWAGDFTIARKLLCLLRRQAPHGYISESWLRDFMISQEYDDLSRISVIFLYKKSTNNYSVFSWLDEKSDHINELPVFGQSILCGSGVADVVGRIQEFASGGSKNRESDAPVVVSAIAKTSSLLNGMFGDEFIFGALNSAGYGGFYEIIYPGEELIKLDNITIMFWLAQAPDYNPVLSPLFCKIKYIGDVLSIYRVDFNEKFYQQARLDSQCGERHFLVGPADLDYAPPIGDKGALQDLNSVNFIHYLTAFAGNKFHRVTCSQLFTTKPWVRFTRSESNLSWSIDSRVPDELRTVLRESLKKSS